MLANGIKYMPRVRVKKAARTSKAIKKRNIVKVKRKSNSNGNIASNVNKNSVRVNALPGQVVGVPFGAMAGAAGGGGGSSSSSTTVVPIPVAGPSTIQTAGITDSTSKDDFKTLRNEIHEGIAGGFNALFNNYWDNKGDWPNTSGFVPAQPDVATVMTNDIGANQPQEVPMDVADVGAPANELPNNFNQGDAVAAPANINRRGGPEPLMQQPPAQGQRQQTEFERLLEQQRREAAQRAQVEDQLVAAQNNVDPRDGMVVANLRVPKRKPGDGVRLAPEARDFMNGHTAEALLNRGQNEDFVRNSFNGNAGVLNAYDGRPSNNRFEKAGRLNEAGAAFELPQQRFPLLEAMPVPPAVPMLGGPLFEDNDDDF